MSQAISRRTFASSALLLAIGLKTRLVNFESKTADAQDVLASPDTFLDWLQDELNLGHPHRPALNSLMDRLVQTLPHSQLEKKVLLAEGERATYLEMLCIETNLFEVLNDPSITLRAHDSSFNSGCSTMSLS